MTDPQLLFGPEEMDRSIRQIVSELHGRITDPKDTALIGIRTHGVTLAERICRLLAEECGWNLPLGILDVTLYRDDIHRREAQPIVRETRIDFDINNKVLILIDDVLYTGRTARCALDAIIDMGRPRCIVFVALVDRGLRELPIQADIVGIRVTTTPKQVLEVHFEEREGEDGIWVRTLPESSS